MGNENYRDGNNRGKHRGGITLTRSTNTKKLFICRKTKRIPTTYGFL